jgi:hypothetical protein
MKTLKQMMEDGYRVVREMIGHGARQSNPSLLVREAGANAGSPEV